MLNRRGFLTALAGLAAGATMDPERHLWIPGRKLISIPRVAKAPFLAVVPFLAVGDIVTFGNSPERFIVTAEATSVFDLSSARFSPRGSILSIAKHHFERERWHRAISQLRG